MLHTHSYYIHLIVFVQSHTHINSHAIKPNTKNDRETCELYKSILYTLVFFDSWYIERGGDRVNKMEGDVNF